MYSLRPKPEGSSSDGCSGYQSVTEQLAEPLPPLKMQTTFLDPSPPKVRLGENRLIKWNQFKENAVKFGASISPETSNNRKRKLGSLRSMLCGEHGLQSRSESVDIVNANSIMVPQIEPRDNVVGCLEDLRQKVLENIFEPVRECTAKLSAAGLVNITEQMGRLAAYSGSKWNKYSGLDIVIGVMSNEGKFELRAAGEIKVCKPPLEEISIDNGNRCIDELSKVMGK
ncbi:hypothetical protein AA313_de0203390 [Arthrobotrys entomopaga]|nr:hypothetical protein AA313_de0203390 [Arthrobotrys entomopaga]